MARTPIRCALLGLVAVALLLAPRVCAASAEPQAPTRIFVEGRPVQLSASVPSLREGRLFLPLLPIARELRDEITVDSNQGVVQARLSHTGETRIYDRATGEVRRDGLVLGVFTENADITIALVPEAQQLPADVLSLLLGVSLQISSGQGEVQIRRETQVTIANKVSGRIPLFLERVDYMETAGVLEGQYGHTLRLSSRGQAFSNIVTSAVEYTGGSNRAFLNLLSAFVSVERPSGQLWTAGDFTAGVRSRLVSTPARGLAIEQPWRGNRISIFGGAALSQATVGAGSFALRSFNTGIIGALFANRSLLRGESGWGFEFGGLHFADATRRSTMFVHQLARRGRIQQFHLDAGFGYFRAGPGPAADLGPSFGVDAVDSLSLRKHSVILRAAYFGDRFITPQVGDSTRGRTIASAAWAAPLSAYLTVGASVAHQRVRVPLAASGNTLNWSAAYNHHRRFLPDVSASHAIATSSSGNPFNNLQVNVSRSFRRVRPTFSYNRLAFTGFTNQAVSSSTVGASVDIGRFGQLQGYQNFSSSQKSGSVDWTPRPLWKSRVQLNGGMGYEHLPGFGAIGTHLSARVGAYVRLPFQNSLQFNFQQSSQRKEFRITLGGPIFARPAPVFVAQSGQGQIPVLPSGIAGRLYQDRNFNGRFDDGVDEPLAGTRVWLDSTLLADTDDAGMYRFPMVLPGPHSVEVDVTTLRADFTSLNPMERKIDVAARVDVTVDFSFVQTGAASGVAWFDANRNAKMDADELPASGLRILCSCGKDTPTTADGVFILGDLLPGEVYITVDQQTLPPLHVSMPAKLKVFIEPGKRLDNLRIAIQQRERTIEERVLPQQVMPMPAGSAATQPTGNSTHPQKQ